MVHKLDMESETRILSSEEIEIRRTGYKDIMELEKRSIIAAKQKANIRWEVDGDDNSKLFHGFINNNNRKNRMELVY